MACDDELCAALEKIEAGLATKPKADGTVFSEAARHLCVARDELTAQPGGRQQLGQVNAIISVVLAGHFPLGEVPWKDLKLARDWLADLCARRRAA